MPLSLSDLSERRSAPVAQLGAPGPDRPTLLRCIKAAIRVPDHGKLVPFRLIEIPSAARDALGEALARRHQELEPDVAPKVLDKDRTRFSFAPTVVAVAARVVESPKVPRLEQELTAGCVAFQLLQAVAAEGFAGNWLTGWAAYDPAVARWFGLEPNELIIGFVHIGTARVDVPERERPDVTSLLSEFNPDSISFTRD